MSSSIPTCASTTGFWPPIAALSNRGASGRQPVCYTDHLLDFIGTHTFEELCREWVAVKAEMGELPFLPSKRAATGPKTAQVDVVAVNWRARDILFAANVKWGKQVVGRDVVETLRRKTDGVLPPPQVNWRVHYALFARAGFTQQHGLRPSTGRSWSRWPNWRPIWCAGWLRCPIANRRIDTSLPRACVARQANLSVPVCRFRHPLSTEGEEAPYMRR